MVPLFCAIVKDPICFPQRDIRIGITSESPVTRLRTLNRLGNWGIVVNLGTCVRPFVKEQVGGVDSAHLS